MSSTSEMRVLYFHQHFSTPQGAAGTRSYEMAQRLVLHGHHVIMVCGSYAVGKTGLQGPFQNGRRRGMVDGIEVVEFDLNYSNSDGLVRRARTFLKFAIGSIGLAMRESYDLVFASTTPLTAGIPGIFARWLRKKTFVFEVRDLWPELPWEMGVVTNPVVLWALSALEWASYHSAHRCVALSPGIAKGIERRGISPDRIVLVPNGCDLTLFDRNSSSPWRPEGVAETDFLAIFTGTHGLANGLDAVLDAALALKTRKRDDIKLALVGDGKLKSQLLQRAEKEQLKNVIFHPPVPKDKLAGLMASANAGMQCLANIPAFYYGTSPNKFFDYIACGLPVLNNYPGWLAELISANDCGWAVPPDDPEAFADALEKAADDPEALKRKSDNAIGLARSEFNRAMLADRWVTWVIDGIKQ